MLTMPKKPEPEAVLQIADTLTPILQHLKVIDLFNAYNVNEKFRSNVLYVVRKKRIALDELRDDVSTVEVFELFGKHMKKLQISWQDFIRYTANDEYTDLDKFIEIITNYCSPGKLVEVDIFPDHMFSRHTECLLQRARPFFENVTQLSLTTDKYNTETERLINTFPANSLRKMTIYDMKSRWQNSPALKSLLHLTIYGNTRDSADLIKFFQLHPNLKSFYCVANLYIESIARFVPSIENFGVLRIISREQIDLFSRFSRLKQLGIEVKGTGRDLFAILDNLPNKHFLEVLSLAWMGNFKDEFNKDESSDESIVERLPALMEKFISIKWLRFDLFWRGFETFILTLLPQLYTVTKCTITTFYDHLTLHVIKLVKNLRILFVGAYITEELYREWMETWRQRQQEESFDYPIVIYLSPGNYKGAIKVCRSIYDENIIQLQKGSDALLKFPFGV